MTTYIDFLARKKLHAAASGPDYAPADTSETLHEWHRLIDRLTHPDPRPYDNRPARPRYWRT